MLRTLRNVRNQLASDREALGAMWRMHIATQSKINALDLEIGLTETEFQITD